MLPIINRSDQSYGRSLMRPQDIVDYAKKNHIPVAALTDMHSLSALPEFLLACQKAGVHGIAGVTIQITESDKPLGEMVLLGKGGKGYAALRDIINHVGHVGLDSKFNPARGMPLNELLSGKHKDLLGSCVVLDGFPGSIGEALIRKSGTTPDIPSVRSLYENPESDLSKLKSQFGDGDYLGVQTPLAKSPIAGVMAIPSANGEEAPVLETTIAIARDDAQLNQTKQWFKNYASDYLSTLGDDAKVNQLLNTRFQKHTLAAAGEPYKPSQPPFLGSQYLMGRCATPGIFKDMPESLPLKGGDPVPTLDEIVEQNWTAFEKSLEPEDRPRYRERLDEEIEVIKHCRFEDYFTNIYKIQRLAEKGGNQFMLRGSAVASLVMRVMGMTPIDPIEEGLLFARFMSKERIEEPDVDIEFVNAKSVSRAINKEFEPGQVAMLSSDRGVSKPETLLTMARDAIRDFYPLDPETQQKVENSYQRLVKPLQDPKNKRRKFVRTMSLWKAEKWDNLAPGQKDNASEALVGIAMNFNAPALGSEVSPGSVVFVPDGAGRYFNVLPSSKGTEVEGAVGRIAQTKYNLGPTGHIKYDLLSNYSFTRAMRAWDTLKLPIDAPLNRDDPAIAFTFQRDAFLGVNQMNGFVGSELASRFKPRDFNELTALNALIRDGGNEALKGMINQYIDNKNSPDNVVLDPIFEPILRETHGSLLYEEQLMRILTDIGGFDWNGADKFRSALKKGKGGIIDEYEGPFIQQAMAKHNVDQQTASQWYQPLRDKRGRFVFNKAHAVAYAHVAVRQCWLKSHHPAQYAAEMVLDSNAKFLGKKIGMKDALEDWGKMHPTIRSNQHAAIFIRAMSQILIREEDNPDSSYKRDPAWVRQSIKEALEQGWLDFAMPPGKDRAAAMSYLDETFKRLEQRGYEPVKHGGSASRNTNNTPAARASAATKNKQDGQGGGGFSPGGAIVTGPKEESVPPANRIDWYNGVMIGHFVDFLNKEGIATQLEVDLTKSASKDHYRFIVKDQQGNPHSFHVAATSTDPIRATAHDSKHSITSGFFQGGAKDRVPTSTLKLAAEIVNLTGMGGISVPMVPGRNGKGLDFDRDVEGVQGKFMKALGAYVRKSKNDLFDVASGGVLANVVVPSKPTSPVMVEISDKTRQYGQEKAVKLFQDSRHISVAGMKDQFAGGHFSIAEVYTDKAFGDKRKRFTEVIANYRKVDDTTPLHEAPLIQDNMIASGGHQRFMFDPAKQRTGKMDLGFTTRRIRGHVCGNTRTGADTLWLTEAAMDFLSFNELQNITEKHNQRNGTSLNVAEQNSVAVRHAGGATDVVSNMLGVKITSKDGKVDFTQVRKQDAVMPFNDEQKKSIKTWLLRNTIHWLSEDTPVNIEGRKQLHTFMQSVGMSKGEIASVIKPHQARSNQTFNQNASYVFDRFIKGEDNIFLHHSNMATWLRSSDMAVMCDDAGKYTSGMAKVEETRGRAFSEMSPDEQVKLKAALQKKFTHISGAKSLGLALDNDGAGKADATTVYQFCKLVDIPVGNLMPEQKNKVQFTIGGKAQPFDLKDHNDYLTVYRKLQQDSQQEAASSLLAQYNEYLKMPELAPPDPEYKNAPEQQQQQRR